MFTCTCALEPESAAASACEWCGMLPSAHCALSAKVASAHEASCGANCAAFYSTFQSLLHDDGGFDKLFKLLVMHEPDVSFSPFRPDRALEVSLMDECGAGGLTNQWSTRDPAPLTLLDASLLSSCGEFDEESCLSVQLVLLTGAAITEASREHAGCSARFVWGEASEIAAAALQQCSVSASARAAAWPRARRSLKRAASGAGSRSARRLAVRDEVARLFYEGCAGASTAAAQAAMREKLALVIKKIYGL